MICFGTMKEVVGNHIVNLIDFDEILATAMETMLKEQVEARKGVGRGGERTRSGTRRNERDCWKREW